MMILYYMEEKVKCVCIRHVVGSFTNKKIACMFFHVTFTWCKKELGAFLPKKNFTHTLYQITKIEKKG